jgi:hypothetical protein
MAQQAKAYETVEYTAKINNKVFRLDYADGYIGASNIRLISTGRKTLLFTPTSGTAEANGNFVLGLSSGANNQEIILSGINEEIEPPGTIRARYREKGRTLMLSFNKKP